MTETRIFLRLGNMVMAFYSAVALEMGGSAAQFVVDEQNADVTVQIRYAREDEQTLDVNGYAKILREGSRFAVALREEWFAQPTVWQILAMLPIASLLMEHGTLTLHASYVRYRGKAIVFSGPSGIGKSTQAALWESFRGAQIVNGDRVLLTPRADGVQVDSHYLCGTSGICRNATTPLAAIVVLEQAPSNTITKLSVLDSFRALMSELDYDGKDRVQLAAITSLVDVLLRNTIVLRYSCRKDESAVTTLERYLYEQCDFEDIARR